MSRVLLGSQHKHHSPQTSTTLWILFQGAVYYMQVQPFSLFLMSSTLNLASLTLSAAAQRPKLWKGEQDRSRLPKNEGKKGFSSTAPYFPKFREMVW